MERLENRKNPKNIFSYAETRNAKRNTLVQSMTPPKVLTKAQTICTTDVPHKPKNLSKFLAKVNNPSPNVFKVD
jgi:hypothetical protein